MKLLERIEALSRIGQTETGICRAAGTSEDHEGKSLIVDYMFDAGMTVHRDEFQNIIGVLPGEGPPIVTGSHTDTVATAGKYDGVLGVLAAIEAVEVLKCDVKSPIEVVVFNDEENSMSGSIGYAATRPDIKAFLELHVEQGPVLDFQQLDIGIVEGIVGQRRCHVSFFGEENHAGTTPMNMRDDALVKAAKLVSFVNQLTDDYDGLVATVGELNVHPNAFSVIPGQVDLTLQVRDLDAGVMEDFVDKVAKEFDLRFDKVHTSEPALCDVSIQKDIEAACMELDLRHTHMPSRASHDAQNFTYCPMGMIFVPSVGGVSHSPKELTTPDQCVNGTRVLIDTIRRLDYT
jgi:N-carbamoyl-L-amino-acid hydrolase